MKINIFCENNYQNDFIFLKNDIENFAKKLLTFAIKNNFNENNRPQKDGAYIVTPTFDLYLSLYIKNVPVGTFVRKNPPAHSYL